MMLVIFTQQHTLNTVVMLCRQEVVELMGVVECMQVKAGVEEVEEVHIVPSMTPTIQTSIKTDHHHPRYDFSLVLSHPAAEHT